MNGTDDHNAEVSSPEPTEDAASFDAEDAAIAQWLPSQGLWEPPAGFADAVVTGWSAESDKGDLEDPWASADAGENGRRSGYDWMQPLVVALAAAVVAAISLTLVGTDDSEQALDAAAPGRTGEQITAAALSELDDGGVGTGGIDPIIDEVAQEHRPSQAPKATVVDKKPSVERAVAQLALPEGPRVGRVAPSKPLGAGQKGQSARRAGAQTLDIPGVGAILVRPGSKVSVKPGKGRRPTVAHESGTATYRFKVRRSVAIVTPYGRVIVTGQRFRVMVREDDPSKRVVVSPLDGTADIVTAGGKRRRIQVGERTAVSMKSGRRGKKASQRRPVKPSAISTF